mmetsp:Transcript_22758/g.32677  ORF Transcript_22758/g.32677 Transcript_22758/m.32677 type:complete len:94 (-) Transcript_22758:2307-2588(-)
MLFQQGQHGLLRAGHITIQKMRIDHLPDADSALAAPESIRHSRQMDAGPPYWAPGFGVAPASCVPDAYQHFSKMANALFKLKQLKMHNELMKT